MHIMILYVCMYIMIIRMFATHILQLEKFSSIVYIQLFVSDRYESTRYFPCRLITRASYYNHISVSVIIVYS